MLFPGCPPGEAEAIAEHACAKYSGRVGRSAAAKEFDPAALRLAVMARIRHEHTRYDRLLGETGDRALARAEVRAEIDRILAQWEHAAENRPGSPLAVRRSALRSPRSALRRPGLRDERLRYEPPVPRAIGTRPATWRV